MKSFLKSLLKHPISVTFYVLYTALCVMILISNIRYQLWINANPGKHAVSYGEGIMYGFLGLVMVGAVFEFVLMLNAIVRKQSGFYVWMMLTVVIQTVAVIAETQV